jgi:hypothetical protein
MYRYKKDVMDLADEIKVIKRLYENRNDVYAMNWTKFILKL